MKTFLISLAVMLIIVVASCQKSAVSPITTPATEKKTMALTATQNVLSNSAFAFHTHTDINLATPGSVQVNLCTGESLQITGGVLQLDFHEMINNNKLTFDQHTNIQGYKLVGVTSGIVYVGSSTSTTRNNISLIDGESTLTETMSVLLTTAGGKNNPTQKFDLHLTFTANGTLTAVVDNFRSSCQ